VLEFASQFSLRTPTIKSLVDRLNESGVTALSVVQGLDWDWDYTTTCYLCDLDYATTVEMDHGVDAFT